VKSLREIPSRSGQGNPPWLHEFLADLEREGLSPRTLRGYRYDVERFLRWYGFERLEGLTPDDFLRYEQFLETGDRLRPASIIRQLQALRCLCRWAHQHGKLDASVRPEMKGAPVSRKRRPLALTEPEVHALLRAAGQSTHGHGKRNYALIQLMLQTGLQVSDVAGLRIADLMLSKRAGWLRVRHRQEGPERQIRLNSSARRALSTYLASRGPSTPYDPVFLSETGDPLSARSVQATVSQLAHRAKLTRLRVSAQTLRDSFALNFLKHNPGQVAELAAQLGHESVDSTRIYLQPSC